MKPRPYPFLFLALFLSLFILSCKKEKNIEANSTEQGIFIRINDGPWIKTRPALAQLYPQGSETYITGEILKNGENAGSIVINWAGPERTVSTNEWDNYGSNNFLYAERDGPNTVIYQEHFTTDNGSENSPGHLKITKYGQVGEMVSGTFIIEKAGIYGEGRTTAKIEGYFNARRIQNYSMR
jgi:hypothetical protein